MKITVKIREVYGNKTIYPVCEKAQLFARLVDQKTLTHRDLCIIERLGYSIEVEQQTLAA